MDQFALIETIKDDLIQELDTLFGNFNLNETATLAESIESFITIYLGNNLRFYSFDFLSLQSNENRDYLIFENNILTSLNINNDIEDNYLLNIVVTCHGIKEKLKLNEIFIAIDGYGSIKTVRFLYPEIIKIDILSTNSLIKNIFEVGYNWFQLKIEELVKYEQISLVTEVYGYIKKIIPSKTLRKHLWFASVTSEYGFRLIEENVAMDLFERINEHSEYFDHSTNRLVAEMLSTRMPKSKVLMQKAIEENKIMDVDIKQAKYTQEGNIYSAAMSSFYGCDSFTIHPILIDKKANIVALYPSNKKSEFEYILSKHIEKLQIICENSTSKIYQVQKLFDAKKSNVGKWGEFAGGFTKAFLDV